MHVFLLVPLEFYSIIEIASPDPFREVMCILTGAEMCCGFLGIPNLCITTHSEYGKTGLFTYPRYRDVFQ